MAIKLNVDLPLKNTEVDRLKGNKKKEKIKAFIDQVKTDYKETEARINQFWTDNQAEYDKLKASSPDNNFLEFWDKFNQEEDIIKLIQPKTLEKIDALFIADKGDSEINEAQKAVYERADIETYIKDENGGITYQIFIIDFIDKIYLDYTDNFISNLLADNSLQFTDLKRSELDKILKNLLDNGCSAFSFTNFEGLSQLVDTENKHLDELAQLANQTRKDQGDGGLSDLLKTLGGWSSVKVAQAWYKDLINTFNNDFKDITGEIKQLKKENLDAVKDELEAREKAINDKQAELNKANKDINDLKLFTTEYKRWMPQAGFVIFDAIAKGGKGGATPTIAGTDEWKATALFLTEIDWGKKTELFNELYENNWTAEQREAIYRIFKANKDNRAWAKGKLGQHFNR